MLVNKTQTEPINDEKPTQQKVAILLIIGVLLLVLGLFGALVFWLAGALYLGPPPNPGEVLATIFLAVSLVGLVLSISSWQLSQKNKKSGKPE